MRPVIIGVGFNILPAKLSKTEYLTQIIQQLEQAPLKIVSKARIYQTKALGVPGQPDYTNTVLKAETSLPPLALLRVLKTCEQQFGRKGNRIPWSKRELDLDLIDFKGVIRNPYEKLKQSKFAFRGSLYLPHMHAHSRSFVLAPLKDILPDWKHPILRQTVKILLQNAERREKNGPGSIINAEN